MYKDHLDLNGIKCPIFSEASRGFFFFNLVEAKILNFLTVHMVRVKSDTEEKETAIIF